MTNSKLKLLQDCENEGMLHALLNYDDYSEIDDPRFQELYLKYKQTTKRLYDHLGLEYGS